MQSESAPVSKNAPGTRSTLGPAIALQIDARYGTVVKQEWQNVVAVLAFAGRNVYLDSVVEIEEPLNTVAGPDQ